MPTLNRLAFTNALTKSRGSTGFGGGGRAQAIGSTGLQLVSQSGLAAPLVGLIVNQAYQKGLKLDQQEAQQFGQELSSILSDKASPPEARFLDAMGLAQEHGMDIQDILSIMREYRQQTQGQGGGQGVSRFDTKAQIDTFKENLPLGAKVKIEAPASAFGLSDLGESPVRIDYTKTLDDIAFGEARSAVTQDLQRGGRVATPGPVGPGGKPQGVITGQGEGRSLTPSQAAGRIVTSGKQKPPRPAKQTQTEVYRQSLQNALAAIESGKDPDAVMQKLKRTFPDKAQQIERDLLLNAPR